MKKQKKCSIAYFLVGNEVQIATSSNGFIWEKKPLRQFRTHQAARRWARDNNIDFQKVYERKE